jgi:SpoIVB peptidase S55
MRGSLRLYAAAGVLACAVSTAQAQEIYPLSKVQRGQTGYGLTTFSGNTPTRFTFEVVSVVHNFLPKMDIILVKSDDPKMAVSGFWQGMSGSPLYIDDKLVCAFSYGFRFNKVAIGGCTPLDYMKKEGDTYRRRPTIGSGPGPRTVAPIVSSTMSDWRKLAPNGDVAAAFERLGPARQSWLLSAPLPPPPPKPATVDDQTLTASIPLAVSGFSAPAFGALSQLLGDSSFVPMRAGGSSTGKPETGPRQFVMGGSMAVELIRGDMSAAGICTVSLIDADKVLACGHPIFSAGEFYAPVSTVNVHTVIPSAQSAFVMGSPVNEIGALVQDRQSTIMADTGLRTSTIPIDIAISIGRGKTQQKGVFHAEVLDNKFLTPAIAGAAVMNAIQHYLPDRDHVTARVDSTIQIKGTQPISFTDYMYASDGAASIMGGVRGLRALVPLINNPFSPLKIERFDVKIDLRFETNFGEIKEARIPTTYLIAGQRNLVEVRMTTFDGSDVYEQVPVDVPASLAGNIVQLELTAGDSAKLDAAPAVDLPSLLSALRKFLPGNVWSATLSTADEGIALDGKLVKDLPPSAHDKLHPQTRTQRAAPYKPLARTVAPASRVVEGTSTMLVRVRAR